ncbi:MAG: hypothetical protein ABIG69_19360 [Bacteroidota bacterium]
MKLTYHQIELILTNPTTKSLLDKVTGAFGLKLSRAISKLSEEARPFSHSIKKIQDEYAVKNEDGTMKTIKLNETMGIIDFGENQEIASKEITELRLEEIEVNIEPIDYDPENEKNKDITGAEILSVLPLIKE